MPEILPVILQALTTALLQPCDRGIIRTAKHYYRFRMLERISREIDNCFKQEELCNSANIAKHTSLLDAVHLINHGVWLVTPLFKLLEAWKIC